MRTGELKQPVPFVFVLGYAAAGIDCLLRSYGTSKQSVPSGMALGHEILAADLARQQTADAAVEVALAGGRFDGGYRVDQRVARSGGRFERAGIGKAAAQVVQVTPHGRSAGDFAGNGIVAGEKLRGGEHGPA